MVHSEDGLDEISIAAPTRASELKNGGIVDYVIKPEDFGIERQALDEIRVASAEDSLEMIPVSYTHLTLPTNREV